MGAAEMTAPTFAPIIEVLLSETGDVGYRLHSCSLDTRMYGEIIASILGQVARMMSQEGNFVEAKVRAEITHFLLNELERPTAEVTMQRLQ
jgi:DNA phosphorothioation-dependent restriction protein DptG